METFSALLALCAWNSPGTGEFPAQRPVTRSFEFFSDLRLNKRLSKQSWCWWFETLSCPLWRQCNGYMRSLYNAGSFLQTLAPDCLTAPSHYLNQCWFIDVELLWHSQLHEPRIFDPSGHWPETVTNAHVSAHFRYSLGASVISTHIRTEGLFVKTTVIYQLKRLCVPDCAYTENMFINSIHISLYHISLTQNILYQIKRDVAVWMRLGCPQRNQRTWWQILATPYTGCPGYYSL